MNRWFLAFLFALGLPLGHSTARAAELAPDPLQGKVARMLALNMPLRHLNREPLDDQISTNALELFLTSLDFEKVYFLASDVAEFKTRERDLDDQVKAGDVAFAYQVYNVYKTRVANRVAFVRELLEQGFDVAKDETYHWKRKDASWPDSEEVWNDLWRRKIKHEYVARMVAKQLGSEEGAAGETDAEDESTNTASAAEAKLPPEEQIRKSYDRFLTIIQDNDSGWVLERYLNAFTRAYDPHTDYMSPNSQEDFSIGMSLSLQGIGALLSSDEGAARVERLIPGGPAERDGRLKAGDKIIAVAQGDAEAVDVLHWPLSKTVRLIRGEKGSKVVLTVIPAAAPTTETRLELIRDEVKLEEQAAKSETREVQGPDGLERKIGIITLPEFYADMSGKKGEAPRSCARDVSDLLTKLRDEKVEGIILDLRNNGGGSLNDAVEMTGLFIESGPVVQIKSQRQIHTMSDPTPEVTYTGPVVVLVNRLSASASEILAAALQDYGRAIIIGDTRTHGKGTVQSLVNLSNANTNMGSLKVTTASFYRIAGGSTQMKGVESDIVLPSPLETMEVGEEQLPRALPWTKVDSAFYEPVGQLTDLLPTLRQRSADRRGSNPRFEAYTNLLARLAERQKDTDISLKLEDRLALAHNEKALQKQLEENDPDATTDEAKKKKNDVIMQESLQILCDWVSLLENKPAAAVR